MHEKSIRVDRVHAVKFIEIISPQFSIDQSSTPFITTVVFIPILGYLDANFWQRMVQERITIHDLSKRKTEKKTK